MSSEFRCSLTCSFSRKKSRILLVDLAILKDGGTKHMRLVSLGIKIIFFIFARLLKRRRRVSSAIYIPRTSTWWTLVASHIDRVFRSRYERDLTYLTIESCSYIYRCYCRNPIHKTNLLWLRWSNGGRNVVLSDFHWSVLLFPTLKNTGTFIQLVTGKCARIPRDIYSSSFMNHSLKAWYAQKKCKTKKRTTPALSPLLQVISDCFRWSSHYFKISIKNSPSDKLEAFFVFVFWSSTCWCLQVDEKIHSWIWDAISFIFPNIMNNLSEIKYT